MSAPAYLTSFTINSGRLLLLLWLILLTNSLQPALAEPLETVSDFQTLGQQMLDSKRPLVLLIEAEFCGYCQRLKAEHLQPMNNNESYRKQVLIHTLPMDGSALLTDFDGESRTQAALSQRYKAYLTPTLLFLNENGEEIAERMLGYNTPEYYGAYLDNAIERASRAMRNRD